MKRATENRESLLLQTPQSLASRFALDVRVEHEVSAIDPARKIVHVTDLRDGMTNEEPYDFVVLAGGATASRSHTTSAVPTYTLRSVEDVDHITAALASVDGPAHAVVIGGFIGLEAVENLIGHGVGVTRVQRGPHVLSPLDAEMAARVRADLVIEASGVRPEVVIARSAGLTIGPTGGIAVDRHQRTSDPAVFAVGDGVEKIGVVDASPTLVTMAGLANRHGRAAADAIAGTAQPSRHRRSPTSNSPMRRNTVRRRMPSIWPDTLRRILLPR